MSRSDYTGDLEHPVCESRLAVVNMRNDAKITDERGIG
jgi:hypothetical protein